MYLRVRLPPSSELSAFNRNQNSISSLMGSSKITWTHRNSLLCLFSKIMLCPTFTPNQVRQAHKNSIKINIQKSVFKFFFIPVRTKSLVTTKPLFLTNHIPTAFFFKNYLQDNMNLFYLFYDMGYLNKKIAFFSLKKSLLRLSNLLTYLVFTGTYPTLIFKLLYILTRKKIKTKKKN